MKKIITTVFLSLFLIFGILMADYMINKDFVIVKTQTVTTDSVKKYINATGTCVEQNKREIKVDLPFSVDKIFVEVGDEIKKDQKLLTLNKDSLQNKLEMQSIMVSSVNNDNLIAKINNYNTDVLSPINGIVTKIYVDEGDSINTEIPVVVISDLDNLIIKANVPESIITDIFVDQKVKITGESFEGETEGMVTKIHPVGEKMSFTDSQSFITVDVSAENYNNIRPESSLKLKFEKKINNEAIVIPFDAIMFEEERPYVFIDNMGYAVKRYVNLGEEYDIDVEVLSGINQGDKLILNPKSQEIEEGDKLSLIN